MTEGNGASGNGSGGEGGKSASEEFAIPEKSEEKSSDILTVEGAREAGWSEEEIKMGEDQKAFSVTDLADKDEEGKAKGEGDKKKDTDTEKKDQGAGDGDQKTQEKKLEPKKKGEDFALNADEEKEFSKAFPDGHNVHGLYFHGKSQRNRAQAAEAERDRLIAENAENKERIKALELAKPKEGDPEDAEDDGQPLTRKQMREMLKKDREEQETVRLESEFKLRSQGEKIRNALTNQENHAKLAYSDYEHVTSLGQKLVERSKENGQFANEVNLASLPEVKRKRAMSLVKQMYEAARNADRLATGDLNAADIAYELGQLHPDFGKDLTEKPAGQSADNSNGQRPERTHGGLTPEEVKQVEKNSARRGSSASLSGSKGHRFVTAENITTDDLNAMDSKTFNAFNEKHPGKVDELMRS